MSSIIAMTEAARRRVEGDHMQMRTHQNSMTKLFEGIDIERVLLIAVILILLRSKANPILLLAILYVTL